MGKTHRHGSDQRRREEYEESYPFNPGTPPRFAGTVTGRFSSTAPTRANPPQEIAVQTGQDQTRICVECGKEYLYSVRDQEYFSQNKFVVPKRCYACRAKKRIQQGTSGMT